MSLERWLILFRENMYRLSQFTHCLQLDRRGGYRKTTCAIREAVAQDLAWANRRNHHIIRVVDSDYPEALKQIYQPPPLLFVKGDKSILNQKQLAIVGSRDATSYGLSNARYFSQALANYGICITSGLAKGIDFAAHQGALCVTSGKTIAVLGHGLDTVYPTSHVRMADAIAEQGAVISEFPLRVPPKSFHFPRRNRIISGLSLGTLVVEAKLKSGSMITAREALEAGREVFAVPGDIRNPYAKGTHALIRMGAKLVETEKDIIEELGGLAFCDTRDKTLSEGKVAI